MTTLIHKNHIGEQLPSFIQDDLINQWLYELIPEISLVELISNYEIPNCSYKEHDDESKKVRPRVFVTYIGRNGAHFYFCNPKELVGWLDSAERSKANYVNTTYCPKEGCEEKLICVTCNPTEKECDDCSTIITLCSKCDKEFERECNDCNGTLLCLDCDGDEIEFTARKRQKT